jgi:hypothetical protein
MGYAVFVSSGGLLSLRAVNITSRRKTTTRLTPFPRSGKLNIIYRTTKNIAMKKLKPHHYIILLTVCVAITVIIVALILSKKVAISVLCTGIGCVIGLIIGTVIKKKSDEGK